MTNLWHVGDGLCHVSDEIGEPRILKTYRIAILDDDPAIREYFMEIITSRPDFDLAGAAPNLSKARELVLNKTPDLILVDVGLPDGSGVDFIPFVKASCDAKVLMVTSFADRKTVVSAINAGADGYLLKDSRADVILDGIDATLAGGAPISPSAAVYLLERLKTPQPIVATQSAESSESALTKREVELLQLFAEGLTYKAAARKLD
ncbi:MAG: response regulator transcription factor, partial [Pseudomonadota bacterium]